MWVKNHNKEPFRDSYIFNKIKNLLYVPVCKNGLEKDWFFLPYIHINLEEEQNSKILDQLEQDYYHICDCLLNHLKNSEDGFIHTSSGQFIQIRSKDFKPYNPIYSKKLKKFISNKNHAFYFKKEFMINLQFLSSKYPFDLKKL